MKKRCLIQVQQEMYLRILLAEKKNFCSLLHLTNVTNEKGNVKLVANVRPLEVFVAKSYYSKQYLDGSKWLSQYILMVAVEAMSQASDSCSNFLMVRWYLCIFQELKVKIWHFISSGAIGHTINLIVDFPPSIAKIMICAI